MKINPSSPAFPQSVSTDTDGFTGTCGDPHAQGLSIRAEIASRNLAAILSIENYACEQRNHDEIIKTSIRLADALIEELNKES